MSYATVADLTAEFGEPEIRELTDRAEPPAGAVDSTVALRALAVADAEIDGIVGLRYAVPMASPPAIIKTIALDLARASLYTNAMPETVALRQKNARGLLAQIGAGKLQLGVSATLVPSPLATGAVEMADAVERVFSRGARGL